MQKRIFPSLMRSDSFRQSNTYFYVHTLTRDLDGTLKLMEPQRINITGQRAELAAATSSIPQ
jgi:hypothetical protein